MAGDPPGGAGAEGGPLRAGVLLGLLYGLAAAGTSAVAVVLPAAGADLRAGTGDTAWVLTGYAVAFGVTTALFGRAADARGPRGPLLAGVALLAGGALAGALAPSLPVLVAARVVQGAGAGAALGVVGAVVVIVSSLGPLAGGIVAAAVGWRGAVALPAAALLLLPGVVSLARGSGSGERVDGVGAALTVLTAVGPVLLLQGVAAGPGVALAEALCFAAGAPALVAHVRRRPDGFLPRAVVTDRVVVRTALAGLTLPAAYFAALLAVPALLAERQGWDALATGLALVPAAVTGALASRAGGRWVPRAGTGRVAGAGLGLAAAGTLLCAAFPGAPLPAVAGVAAITAGYGLAQPALLGAVAGATDPALRGIALGVFTLLFLVGGAVGSALVGGTAEVLGLPAGLAAVAALPAAGAVVILTGRARADRPGGSPAASREGPDREEEQGG